MTRPFQRHLAIATITGVAFLAAVWACSGLGEWLVVNDPLMKADAIVVLGGHLPYRAIDAARLYSSGWAPEIWVSQTGHPRDLVVESLEIGYIREHEYSRRILEKLGVPPHAVRILERKVVNTSDEVLAVAERLHSTDGSRVIIVSSKAHTRRIQETWRARTNGDLKVVVRYTEEDTYRPDRWWATSTDVLTVFREVGGILNVWAGFPLEPARN